MACPDCGYLMTAFDKECPRCQKYKRPERSCPHCGTVNSTAAPLCKECNHSFQAQAPSPQRAAAETLPQDMTPPLRIAPKPAEAPLHSRAQVQPPASIPPPLTAEALACRMCGNTSGQKLTAICRAGSWTTQSRGYAAGIGSDGYGHTVLVGGPTASTTFGQTALASLLLPPTRPTFRPSWTGSVLVPIAGLLGSLIALSEGPLAASIGVLLTSGLWVIALLTEGRTAADKQARHDADCASWEQQMQVWNRLFYCSRCDHVYDPQVGTATAPYAMNTLLMTQNAAVRPLYEPPDQAAVVKAASLAFGVGALLLIGIWSLTISQQHEAQEEAQQVTALRTPLETQFAAALPEANAAITAGDQAAARTIASDDYTASERQYQLSTDLGELKNHLASAQQDLDALSKPGELAVLQEDAAEASTEITGMQSSRQSVIGDLQSLNLAPVDSSSVNPSNVNPSGATSAPPGSGFSITTRAGGGQPPNPALLPH